MSKIITAVILITVCFIPASALAADDTVGSSDLIDNASEYDGQSVVYTGEVIGDIMNRGEYTWLNVSDGNNAIGIWVKSGDTGDLKTAGRYDAHGDTVRITGVFHRACADHGGDFDIHAEKVELIQKGYAVSHTVEPIKVLTGIVLFLSALICLGFVIKKRMVKMTAK
jgi:hypothetical protein